METTNTAVLMEAGNVLQPRNPPRHVGTRILHLPVIPPSEAREPVTVTVTT